MVTPVTAPVAGLTVATAVLALLHAPPGTASVNVMTLPVQPVDGPPIAAGMPLMVTSAVAIHMVTAAV